MKIYMLFFSVLNSTQSLVDCIIYATETPSYMISFHWAYNVTKETPKVGEIHSPNVRIKLNASACKLLFFNKNSADVILEFHGNTVPQVESKNHVVHLMSNSSLCQERWVNKVCKIVIG